MKIKICGITTIEDARKAVELGAWALGFIFAPQSPRYLHPMAAGKIIRALPREVLKVGVFVNSSRAEILEAVTLSEIDTVQLHGDESPELVKSLPLRVFKTFTLNSPNDLSNLEAFENIAVPLVDSARPGTGTQANWELAKQIKGEFILAGGIHSENLEEALTELSPFAIDVSSGVESSIGVKDSAAMEKLFEKAKGIAHVA